MVTGSCLTVIEEDVVKNPTRIVGILANSTSPMTFTQITLSQLSQAVDYAAWWIDSQLGASKSNAFEPIAYVGLQDFRYWVMEIAGMKTGHPILLFSPRNALVNNASLFESCGCNILMYTAGMEVLAQQHKSVIPKSVDFRNTKFRRALWVSKQTEGSRTNPTRTRKPGTKLMRTLFSSCTPLDRPVLPNPSR